jgi:hypothetical protein
MLENQIPGTTFFVNSCWLTSPQLGAFSFFRGHGKHPGGCLTLSWPSGYLLVFTQNLVLWMEGLKLGLLYGITFNDKGKPELVYHMPHGNRVCLHTLSFFANSPSQLYLFYDILDVVLS